MSVNAKKAIELLKDLRDQVQSLAVDDSETQRTLLGEGASLMKVIDEKEAYPMWIHAQFIPHGILRLPKSDSPKNLERRERFKRTWENARGRWIRAIDKAVKAVQIREQLGISGSHPANTYHNSIINQGNFSYSKVAQSIQGNVHIGDVNPAAIVTDKEAQQLRDDITAILHVMVDRLDEIDVNLLAAMQALRNLEIVGETISDVQTMVEDLWVNQTGESFKTGAQRLVADLRGVGQSVGGSVVWAALMAL